MQVTGDLSRVIRNKDGLYEGDLRHYFRVVFFKAENLLNPYHNFMHLCYVFYLCFLACLFYKDKLTKRQIRNLLIAALFHDFDHTGKLDPDLINIALAIDGLREHILHQDEMEFENIATLMRGTQWPHVIPGDALTLEGQILRDADLCQVLQVVWMQPVIIGLSAEKGCSPIQMLALQPEFLSNLKFLTEWARSLFPTESIYSKINEAEDIFNILTEPLTD